MDLNDIKDLDDWPMSPCACLGPIGKDPYCPCKMRQNGLEPTNMWTQEDIKNLSDAVEKMLGKNKR